MKLTTVRQGRQLEDYVAGRLRATGLDIRATRTPGSGSGTRLKADVDNKLNLAIECKRAKRLPSKVIAQAFRQALGDTNPVIVWAPPGQAVENAMVMIEWHHFETLLKAFQAPRTENPDRTMRAKAERLKNAAKKAIRAIESIGDPSPMAMAELFQPKHSRLIKEASFSLINLKREAFEYLKEFKGL